jgi:hypothetical protein
MTAMFNFKPFLAKWAETLFILKYLHYIVELVISLGYPNMTNLFLSITISKYSCYLLVY